LEAITCNWDVSGVWEQFGQMPFLTSPITHGNERATVHVNNRATATVRNQQIHSITATVS